MLFISKQTSETHLSYISIICVVRITPVPTTTTRVLLTASRSIGRLTSTTEGVYRLGPLGSIEAARLMIARAPMRSLLPSLRALANHPLMTALGGIPYTISLCATLLTTQLETHCTHHHTIGTGSHLASSPTWRPMWARHGTARRVWPAAAACASRRVCSSQPGSPRASRASCSGRTAALHCRRLAGRRLARRCWSAPWGSLRRCLWTAAVAGTYTA